jgi:hypothetical protein
MTPYFADSEERKDYLEALKGVEKKTGSKIVKEMLSSEQREKGLKLVKSIIEEHLEEYAEGEMDWEECLDGMMEDLKVCDPDEYSEGDEEEEPAE